MKTNFNAKTSSLSWHTKLSALLLLGTLSFMSCNKKDTSEADETMETTVDSAAMEPTESDAATMPMDSTAMSDGAAAGGQEAYGDDDVSIQKALRTIKEAKVKDNDAGNEIVLGTTDKAKRKCAAVTFKDGAMGRVCASKDVIDRIKAECGKTKDCEVKDAM